MQKAKIAIISVLLLMLTGSFAIAEEKTLILGGASGWPALSVETGLSRAKGRLGQDAIVLATVLPLGKADSAPSSAKELADLYLPFDRSGDGDITNHYQIVSSALIQANAAKARRGAGAAICNTDGTGLVLKGAPGTLFSTPGDTGSFSIDFWIKPTVTENGSVIFQWRSSRIAGSGSLFQYIRASVMHNHVEWTFSNIWTTASGTPLDMIVSGRKNLIPGVWSHHELSYDAETGVLEYFVDGSTEDLKYTTSTGTERGDIYPAIFGTASEIEIAPRFSGLLDEFQVTRKKVSFDSLDKRHAVLDRYPSAGGRFESMPIDSLALNSSLNGIAVVKTEPGETGTAFFVRAGDNFYQWTDSSPAWIPVMPGEKLTGISGRYFQIAGELYPDGRGESTPSVTSITVKYEEDSPPWPPVKLFASPGDGSVTLTWPSSIDFDTSGYLVYYGDHPGEYLGEGSPFDAGANRTFTVSGLKNGKVYYFCVAAYDASGPRYPGDLSVETYARPQAIRTPTAR